MTAILKKNFYSRQLRTLIMIAALTKATSVEAQKILQKVYLIHTLRTERHDIWVDDRYKEYLTLISSFVCLLVFCVCMMFCVLLVFVAIEFPVICVYTVFSVVMTNTYTSSSYLEKLCNTVIFINQISSLARLKTNLRMLSASIAFKFTVRETFETLPVHVVSGVPQLRLGFRIPSLSHLH